MTAGPAGTVWRHPQPLGAAGRCVGQRTDLAVDPRKAKRLAHRIRAHARRHGLPRAVLTSPLRRAADVGRWLRRWGWAWAVDPRLAELDFGAWDGRPWAEISAACFDAWLADFAGFAFDGGESLQALLARAGAWAPPAGIGLAVAHGGWMLARRWQQQHPGRTPRAAEWPRAPRYGEAWPLDYRKP